MQLMTDLMSLSRQNERPLSLQKVKGSHAGDYGIPAEYFVPPELGSLLRLRRRQTVFSRVAAINTGGAA
jgi:hypothetical protein